MYTPFTSNLPPTRCSSTASRGIRTIRTPLIPSPSTARKTAISPGSGEFRNLDADRAGVYGPDLTQDNLAVPVKQERGRYGFHAILAGGVTSNPAQHIQAQHGGPPFQIPL